MTMDFDSLSVKFDYQGTNIIEEGYTAKATAQIFLTNRIISLDDWASTNDLERQFNLEFDIQPTACREVFALRRIHSIHSGGSTTDSYKQTKCNGLLPQVSWLSFGFIPAGARRSSGGAGSSTHLVGPPVQV